MTAASSIHGCAVGATVSGRSSPLALGEETGEPSRGSLEKAGELGLHGGQLHTCLCHLMHDGVARIADVACALVR
jgi:hypothetical protein